MKILTLFLIVFSFWGIHLQAQEYHVSKILDSVYYNGNLLQKDANINGLSKLTAKSRNAALRVVSANSGSIAISFVNGKITTAGKENKSELYELVVQDYIDKYTSFKSTQTKSVPVDFDWFNFFYQYPSKVKERKMLIVEGEKIPLQSRNLQTGLSYRILAVTHISKDDSCIRELPIRDNTIEFPDTSFPIKDRFSLDVYIDFLKGSGKNKRIRITDRPIEASYLTIGQMNGLIGLFHEEPYRTPVEAKNDLFSYLDYNYGRYYDPAITELIDKVFAN